MNHAKAATEKLRSEAAVDLCALPGGNSRTDIRATVGRRAASASPTCGFALVASPVTAGTDKHVEVPVSAAPAVSKPLETAGRMAKRLSQAGDVIPGVR